MKPKRSWRERKLLFGVRWAEILGRYDKALARILELERLRPLQLRGLAFKAMLLLRNDDPQGAHDLFLQVREAAKRRDDPEGQYITHYAQAWLANIRRDPFNTREQERRAAAIDCDPRLKRMLRLRRWDHEDTMTQEFDAWVKANNPTEEDLRKRRI